MVLGRLEHAGRILTWTGVGGGRGIGLFCAPSAADAFLAGGRPQASPWPSGTTATGPGAGVTVELFRVKFCYRRRALSFSIRHPMDDLSRRASESNPSTPSPSPGGGDARAAIPEAGAFTRVVRSVVTFAVALFSLSLGRTATAGEGPISRAAMAENIRTYYHGERITSYSFMIFSTLSLAAGGVLATRDNDFARGLGWPMLGVGLIEIFGGTAYLFQMNSRLDRYSALIDRDPVSYKREELAETSGTARRYTMYRTIDVVLTLVGAGIATYGFAEKRDLVAGFGAGLAFEALTSFSIDSFGSFRTTKYKGEIERFDPNIAVQGGASNSPLSFSVSGKF